MTTKRPCIVVGYDGSETSRRALDWARERAGTDGAVVAVHAFEPPSDWLGHPNYDRVLQEHRARGQAVIDELPAELKEHAELLGETPASAIANVASARGADEIVVGSRGFTRVRAALGSVSHDLLHLARCPVVVIPPASEPDQPARS